MNETSTLQTTSSCQANLKTTKLSISLALIISGIVVNISVVAALLRKLARLKGFSLLVMHLAFADLMVFFTAAPFLLMSVENQQLAFTTAACKATAFFNRFTTISSMFILTAMSGFRFYGVRNPLSYRVSRAKTSRINVTCGLLWMFSLVLSVTPLLGWGEYEPIKDQCWCALDSSKHKINYMTVLVLAFCLPTALTCYFLVGIMTAMRKPRKTGTRQTLSQAQDKPVETHLQAAAQGQQTQSSGNMEDLELDLFEAKPHLGRRRFNSNQHEIDCNDPVILSFNSMPDIKVITAEPDTVPKPSPFTVGKSFILARKYQQSYEVQKAWKSEQDSRNVTNVTNNSTQKFCSRQGNSAFENINKHRRNRANKTFPVLIGLFLVYIAFCGPTYIVWSWYAFSDVLGSAPPRALFAVFRILAGVQSVVNCLIYGIRHKDIRKEVIQLWKDIALYMKSKLMPCCHQELN